MHRELGWGLNFGGLQLLSLGIFWQRFGQVMHFAVLCQLYAEKLVQMSVLVLLDKRVDVEISSCLTTRKKP